MTMTAKHHNYMLIGFWVAVVGIGLIWLHNRNVQAAKSTTAVPPAPVATPGSTGGTV